MRHPSKIPGRNTGNARAHLRRRTTLRGTLSAGALAAGLGVLPALVGAQPAGKASGSASVDRLEELVVTSSLIEMPRRQIGTAVSVIRAEGIELRGYNSLADVLRTQPGIGVSNNGGPGKTTSLSIRGEEGYRTLLIIDGVKAVDPSGPQASPRFENLLTTGDLRRVEILRGPQGFIYGADAGGVVNVITRTGEGDPGGRVAVEHGAFGTRQYDASVAGGSDLGDYFVSVSDLETDGFNSRLDDTVLADDDGAENTTLHAKLGWNATDDLRLQLVARDIGAEAMHDGCFSTTTFAPTHACATTTEQTTYKLSAAYDGDIFSHAFGYSGIDVARDSFAEGGSAFGSRGELSRFEYTGTYVPSDSLTLVYGLDFQDEAMAGSESLERDQHGYYVEYQGAFGAAFFLSAGARHDRNEDFGEHTSTRLSGAYVQELGGGRSLKYRASFGTGFRAPSLYEFAFNRGPFARPPASGITLREEKSRGYDLGVEYDAPSGLHVEATWFDQEIENEIFYDLVGSSGYLQSTGTSKSTGIELAVRAPMGERWEILGNWTRNDTEGTDNEVRLRRPRNVGNVGILYSGLAERLRVVVNYRATSDAVDVGNVLLDDYGVVDLSMGYRLNDKVDLHGRIQNLTDEEYQEVFGYRTAGRAAYAGVRLRF